MFYLYQIWRTNDDFTWISNHLNGYYDIFHEYLFFILFITQGRGYQWNGHSRMFDRLSCSFAEEMLWTLCLRLSTPKVVKQWWKEPSMGATGTRKCGLFCRYLNKMNLSVLSILMWWGIATHHLWWSAELRNEGICEETQVPQIQLISKHLTKKLYLIPMIYVLCRFYYIPVDD